jgi:hypothetical protein
MKSKSLHHSSYYITLGKQGYQWIVGLMGLWIGGGHGSQPQLSVNPVRARLQGLFWQICQIYQ